MGMGGASPHHTSLKVEFAFKRILERNLSLQNVTFYSHCLWFFCRGSLKGNCCSR